MTDKESYALVGDIGGTNARFALVRRGSVRPESIKVLPCSNYDSLDSAMTDYLQQVDLAGIAQVCLAVASPVSSTDDPQAPVGMTNSHWRFDRNAIRKQFDLQVFKVVNDFTAMALGVPHVDSGHLVPVCGGPPDTGRPKMVMGPGTGLGVSGLVPIRDSWMPLFTEGGHVDFAPTDDTEIAILQIFRAMFGRVSVERILCGQGLLDLYRAHAGIQGIAAPLDAPEKITEAAVANSDPLATLALRHFCQILGRVAGNAVLTLGSFGGVYLCGGIVPRFIDFFLESGFQAAFEDKGRMRPLLERTPVYIVTESYTGLLGAAEALRNPEV